MHDLTRTAEAFVTMAHRIVWCTAATTSNSGAPRSRVLHPIWEWDGERLQGWIATGPDSSKAADLAAQPKMSVTYWDPTHDTCTADCDATWETSAAEREAGWNRFAQGPAPVGYDPKIIPGWTSPSAEAFGVLRLDPYRLRVMPGTFMMQGVGELLRWRR
jgi:general stress protein 26